MMPIHATFENKALSNAYYAENITGQYAVQSDGAYLTFNVVYLIGGAYYQAVESIPGSPYILDISHTNDDVDAYHVEGELSNDAIYGIESYNALLFPLAQVLEQPTAKYNCHSYAWYSQDVDENNTWINNPEQYYAYHRYCPLSTPQVGDIICYYDDMGTVSDQADDENKHSGIVTDIESDGTVIITSKWGPAGLYVHEVSYSPYLHSGKGGADYVVYYREPTRFRYRYSTSLYDHSKTCLRCNVTVSEPHNWIASLSGYRCSLCNMTASTVPGVMSIVPEEPTK